MPQKWVTCNCEKSLVDKCGITEQLRATALHNQTAQYLSSYWLSPASQSPVHSQPKPRELTLTWLAPLTLAASQRLCEVYSGGYGQATLLCATIGNSSSLSHCLLSLWVIVNHQPHHNKHFQLAQSFFSYIWHDLVTAHFSSLASMMEQGLIAIFVKLWQSLCD